jgi:hypothetical protein
MPSPMLSSGVDVDLTCVSVSFKKIDSSVHDGGNFWTWARVVEGCWDLTDLCIRSDFRIFTFILHIIKDIRLIEYDY